MQATTSKATAEEPNRVHETPDYDPTNIAHLDEYDRILNVYLIDWEHDFPDDNAHYIVSMRGILVGQTPEEIAQVGYLKDFALKNMEMLKVAREMYLRGQGQRKVSRGYRERRHKDGKLWIQTMHKHVGLPPEVPDIWREDRELPRQEKPKAAPPKAEPTVTRDCMMQ